jgi:hypothetical protein
MPMIPVGPLFGSCRGSWAFRAQFAAAAVAASSGRTFSAAFPAYSMSFQLFVRVFTGAFMRRPCAASKSASHVALSLSSSRAPFAAWVAFAAAVAACTPESCDSRFQCAFPAM